MHVPRDIPIQQVLLVLTHARAHAHMLTGTPRKLSYGVYTTLGALLNLSWWLLTMALVGLLAMGLVWLSFAFVTSSALNMGIT